MMAPAGEWTFLCNPKSEGFYKLYINWGGNTSTNAWTYYRGMLFFGNVTSRANPNYGVVGNYDITSMTLATPASDNSWAEGVPTIGIGSYGEVCKICLKPNGLYVYRNRAISNGGSMVAGASAGAIWVAYKLIRDEAWLGSKQS